MDELKLLLEVVSKDDGLLVVDKVVVEGDKLEEYVGVLKVRLD